MKHLNSPPFFVPSYYIKPAAKLQLFNEKCYNGARYTCGIHNKEEYMSFQKIDKTNTVRKMGRNCIMVYGYKDLDLERLEECRKMVGIDEMVLVLESDIKLPIEKILEKPAYDTFSEVADAPGSLENTIVFSGHSPLELNRFIDATKSLSIARPIFAGTTPLNLTWTFEALVEELVKEREEIKKMRALSNKG